MNYWIYNLFSNLGILSIPIICIFIPRVITHVFGMRVIVGKLVARRHAAPFTVVPLTRTPHVTWTRHLGTRIVPEK